ncbi:WSC domain-containing protein [Rhodocollybia butyracea]|uniref:WSC domain-containing protein n=1 Tax=Rhodocollybia butyracea TaxID=206335 RepID=A0A9P5PD47_9AGAR|nr:WSC domain-containing protein [Rhodocollybia butyracea]
MTVQGCVAFCSSVNYIYAGVEFADECYCDSTIQIPSVPSPLANCDEPCAGNSSELCGGMNNILIYTNGEPAPVLVQDVEQWSYAGCFTDSVDERVLTVAIDIPAGVTAESCLPACQTEGFVIAGLENGQECWCGNTLGNSSVHVSDNECTTVCVSDHDQYCGAPNRLALYQFASNSSSLPPATCAQTDIANFTLVAKLNDAPQVDRRVRWS